jgi:adenylate cyclase
MFGNVGLTDRLTFSAFGSAVNEVQRLQMLTKKYPQRLIASKDFATYTGGGWVTLGKEKLAGVKQKLTILHPDVADIDMSDEDGFDVTYDGMSDAEQLMLLIRGGGQSMIEVNGEKKLQ